MDASWKTSFEEELMCPICLNVFEEPVQLPCKHNFCKVCISKAWAKNIDAVRCPECNHDYALKPTLEKNCKLNNIVWRFNALNAEKVPAVLQCFLCRRTPLMPVRKVCLRCKEPCCKDHIKRHMLQPCPFPGHLLVDTEELSAWICPKHKEYRLLHCEEEQKALCQLCCNSHCAIQGHTVCDVDTKGKRVQEALMSHQDRLERRVQKIDDQLTKLKSDKTVIKHGVTELKERVKAKYQRMHAMLKANQAKTVQMLEKTLTMYVEKNSKQVQNFNGKREETVELLSSVQKHLERADSINFMKNTRPSRHLMDRSNLTGDIPPLRGAQLNPDHFRFELAMREKHLQELFKEQFSEPILEIVQFHSSSAASTTVDGAGLQKRKYGLASNTAPSTSQDPPLLHYSSKKPFLADPSQRASAMYTSDRLPHGPHVGPGHSRLLDHSAHHMLGIGSTSSRHSGSIFRASHGPSGDAPQRDMDAGLKEMMCNLNNFSQAPAPRARPLFQQPHSFTSMTALSGFFPTCNTAIAAHEGTDGSLTDHQAP